MDTTRILDYDLHPPDDLRLFVIEPGGVLRVDDEALVTEARRGDVVLRHYAFRDFWFKVNFTTNPSGEFVETSAPGVDPFAFNCDIATPMVRAGNSVYAVDLCVDVLVRRDGLSYQVCDEDALTDAVARGWVSSREARGARKGVEQFVKLIEQEELLEFLSRVHPFGLSSAREALPMRRLPLSEAPLLQPSARATWE